MLLRLRPASLGVLLCLVLCGQLATRRALAADAVTFDEALAMAPQAPGARAAARALTARRAGDEDIGGTAGPLTLTVNPGYRFTPDAERGLEGQVAVAQGWNLADLTGARRRAASAERRALSAEVRAAALSSRLDAARRWIDVRTLEELSVLAQQQLELAERGERFMARAAAEGVRTAMDAAEARAYRAEIERQRFELGMSLQHAGIDLAVAMGRTSPEPLRTTGPAPRPALPELRSLDAYVTRAQQLPEAVALRLAATAARAREAEESAAYGSHLSAGVQLQREPPAAYTALGTFSLALAPFDRGQRQRSIARAEAESLAARAAQAQLEASAGVSRALYDLRAARERKERVETDWLVAAEELADRLERAVAVGEATVYELLEARRRHVEVQQLLVRARADVLWAEIRLWLLIAELERTQES